MPLQAIDPVGEPRLARGEAPAHEPLALRSERDAGGEAQSGLGLAPGIAFGPEGEGFVRWCFAASEVRLADGVDRLQRYLARRESALAT